MSSVLTAPLPMGDYDPLRDKSYRLTGLGPSVVDFLAWKETGGAADSTLDQYERDLARGCLLYPSLTLATFGDSEMLQVAKQFKPKERRVRVAAWRAFYKWALKTRRATVNPCDALPDFKQPGQRVYDVFSDEEIGVLCDLPLRDGALMQLLLDGGLRKGEARRFKLAHLRSSGRRNEIVILSSKGDKDRVLPASPGVTTRVAELALVDGIGPSDQLWYAMRKTPQMQKITRGRVIAEGTFHRWWERNLTAAGVRYRNPHMTRHTFATRYLRRGGTIERLSIAMGHESIQTTFDLYAHLDTRDLDAEFAAVFGTQEINP